MKRYFKKITSSSMAKNSLWTLGGSGLKLIIQAAYFVIIARTLEAAEFGEFVAVVAIAAILSPFVGLGTSNLVIRNVARDPASFSRSWGNGLLVTTVTGFLGLALVLSCSGLLPAHLHRTVLVLVACSDLVFGKIVEFCSFAFASLENFHAKAQLNVWSSLSRFIALVALASVTHHPTIEQWSAAYMFATAATAVGALLWGLISLGKPSLKLDEVWPDLSEGIYFSVGLSAQTIYNDIDKSMLARLGDLTATGIYGAAYRIIEVSIVPVRSILTAANPGFFRAGRGGPRETLVYMQRFLPKAMGYSALISIALLLFAPVVPLVLGKEYAQAVGALRWLSVLPFIKTIHSFLADAITGAGFQRMRTIIQAVVAALNILLNLWIIPAYSWRGAAWSSIACDAALAVLLAIGFGSLLRKQRSAEAVHEISAV